MGLASALSTALTGLSAAETTIDVVGNNLANSNTVGFKASSATFATQFLQTLSLGSTPTTTSGGTNPRQIGLGTMVADITPNFNQGTVEISSSPTDLAIQGDGFFIVEDNAGAELYTRNGIFRMNAQNELVTITGNRVLGYGIDDQFQIQSTLEPVEIPLGKAAVAQATQNAYLEGTLSPTGDLADTAEIIQTGVLSDGKYAYPTTKPGLVMALAPDVTGSAAAAGAGAGTLPAGAVYRYEVVFADSAYGVSPNTEGTLSAEIAPPVTLGAPGSVDLSGIPNDASYSYFRVYRSTDGGDYFYVGEENYAVTGATTFTDDGSVLGAQYDDSTINGSYSYYVTFIDLASGIESRPSELSNSLNMTADGRIHLTGLPTPDPADPTGWDVRRIYRNTTAGNTYYLLSQIDDVTTTTFTDKVSDATLTAPGNPQIDLNGPEITATTLLSNVVLHDGTNYENLFQEGSLSFTGKKGGRTLATKEMDVTAASTVQDMIYFMEESLGIRKDSADPNNPLPGDVSGADPGGLVTSDGRIRLVGNNGEANALDVGLSGLRLAPTGQVADSVNLSFGSIQSAVGESAVANFIVYDSLGIPLDVRLTAVLESKGSASTTYRWFADSPDNDPVSGSKIAVGTGLLTFDSRGNFTSSTEATVSIDRRNISSASPLEFELDFSQLSGLHSDNSNLNVSRQDGSEPGELTSFIVGEDGTIRGVFSNGVTRDLGRIILARFGNPTGLEQKGENLFAVGENSGLPIQAAPGQQGIGTVIAGAVELSNADIGGNLIDLILASTMYRGNTRVITTAQQMLDELLQLRR